MEFVAVLADAVLDRRWSADTVGGQCGCGSSFSSRRGLISLDTNINPIPSPQIRAVSLNIRILGDKLGEGQIVVVLDGCASSSGSDLVEFVAVLNKPFLDRRRGLNTSSSCRL